jgi:protein-disulfide isomerase
MKKLLIFFIIVISVYSVQAQRQRSTPTPLPTDEAIESTAEISADAPLLSEAAADLPQSRAEDGAFVLGDPDAPITLIVFSDWACPHCQTYHTAIEPMLTEYLLSGAIKFEHRMLPTAGGMITVYAGTLAECADDLQEGGFWRSYFLLYDLAMSGDYDPYIITTTIAEELDLDPDELYACTEEIRQVRTDVELANEIGIQGTPAVMVRYADGEPEFVEFDDITYDRGSVPEEVLRQVIEAAQDTETSS